MEETIAAISTPIGEGAIALVRMSGPAAVRIAGGVFRGRRQVGEMHPRMQHYGSIWDADRKLDDVMLTVHRAPASYTGEDVVEIACHGGMLITRRILELLLMSGARSAAPGEFTQRAFLHGKMDLTQAEAVMDLISAQTDLALQAAQEQLAGRLGQRMEDLRHELLELLAHIEAYIDFPEEDIDPETGAALLKRIDALRTTIAAILETAGRGRILREGVRTVIFGAPNVGKSSLLNLLLGYERAIVNAAPGTTRDSIEEVINLRGIPLRLIDTAGIREARDAVEKEGIERTLRLVQEADLILHVEDASVERSGESCGGSGSKLLVLNKCDLPEHACWKDVPAARLSCKDGTGAKPLEEAIAEKIFSGGAAQRDWSIAINARTEACLQNALAYLEAGRRCMVEGISAEYIAEELRAALNAVGDVVGRACVDDLLEKIFATFCIGK